MAEEMGEPVVKDEMMEEEDVDMDHDDAEHYSDDDEADKKGASRVYLPGISRALKEGEEMDFDPEAYKVFHAFETSFPCLSFDIVHDKLGDNRTDFPLTSYLVSGTQAEKATQNMIYVLKLANLHGMEEASDDEEEDDDDIEKKEEEEKAKEPKLYAAMMRHRGGINRVKSTVIGDSNVCAVWNDLNRVQIWNLAQPLEELEKLYTADQENSNSQSTVVVNTQTPLHTFAGHTCEGFALGWSPLKVGMLASGDSKKNLHIWKMHEGGQWVVDQRSLIGHKKSVEDVAWSPTEESLLVSCSSDKTVRLWDTRMSAADACVCTVENAHQSDVNVLSWNDKEPLIATGGDDALLNIWSLKTIQYGEPVAKFKHHAGPITSVEWSPHESTTLIASGEDDQTTIWDLAMETEDGRDEDLPDIPPQLMFIHCGQKEVKEVHWHRQIPGLAFSTSLSGFNVFRTINC
uniref:Glutamate-rich WD repeat-containing protein 1 n=1 Tax=Steinernema glaseri TaxID=37863 RepID=A0A1I7ZFL4_9BILA